MLLGMDILSNNRGFSRIEVICLAGISVVLAALLAAGGWYVLGLMRQGDDANLMNTAWRIASVNAQGACLVNDCPGPAAPDHAKHADSTGTLTAYFERGSNKLVSHAPSGYNEGDRLEIDGRVASVEPNTLVVRATSQNGTITCEWVEPNPSS